MWEFDMYLIFFSSFILLISVLLSIVFLTLLERKVLGYVQFRKGPNKVSFSGLFQSFSDGIKLLSKEQTYPLFSNFFIYYFCPVMNLFLALFIWLCLPFLSVNFNFQFSVLFFLCVSSISVYSIMLAGWSSNSNYALLGAIRAIAQTISYEVSLSLILLSFMFLISGFNFMDLIIYQEYIWFFYFLFPLSLMLFVSSLAETNRTPFDFAEGESELVSGFNVEYSSGGFVMIFLAEYGNILFMSILMVILFLGSSYMSVVFLFKIIILVFFWLWVRGTLPRYRYDKLMFLAWKVYLSVSLNYLMFVSGLKMFIFVLLI